ncbi:FHA domain-containing protein [Flavobacterium sp.]|uniref:FHA domain-containing protein n=1 Tax=Flavobacterium sp. TaxID=239 RepID=UPI003B9BE5BA
MKKVIFKENCSFCNKENTIVTTEGSEGKSIKNKCFHCKKMMFLTVPVANDTSNGNAVTNKTKVGSVNQTEKKLSLLVLASENNKEQHFEISQPFLTIGRKNNTTIQPDIAIETEDTMMSRAHALIKRNDKNNTFSIQDNGSLNHTFINEEKLKTFEDKSRNEIIVLQNNDKIRLGRTIIQVTIL